MIPLPPHRTKGGALLGASGPGNKGPFGLWGGPDPEPEAEGDSGGRTSQGGVQDNTAPLCGQAITGPSPPSAPR